jgi:hypothetical protein
MAQEITHHSFGVHCPIKNSISFFGIDLGEGVIEHFLSPAQTVKVQVGESEGITLEYFQFLLTHWPQSNTLLLRLNPCATVQAS